MRILVFVLLFSVTPFTSFSQIMGDGETYLTMERINPTFQGGGMKEFYAYINKEFDYSKIKANGKMIASFTINETGEIKNIKVTQFLDVESATEIIRVLKLAPKWEPAKRNAKPISVDITLPLNFGSGKHTAVDESVIKSDSETSKTIEEKNNQKSDNNVTSGKVEVESNGEKKIPGGLKKFYDFIKQNYRQPNISGIKGKVIVSFTINEDGTLDNYNIVKNLGHGTAEELIRVLKLTSGKWTPAEKNGKKVKSTFTLPLNIDTGED